MTARTYLQSVVAAPAPQAPSDATLALLRGHVDRVMKDGDEAQRKAVMQALVQEVRVVSRDEILPTFRVPDEHCATQVRIDDGIVDLACLCTNTPWPTVTAHTITMSPPNSVFVVGGGDR